MAKTFANKLSGLFQGSGLVFAGFSLWYLLTFLSKFVLIRTLSPSDFGAISIGITILTTGSVLLQLGLNQGIARFLPRQSSDTYIKSTIVSGFWVVTPIVLIAIGVLYFKADYIASRFLGNTKLTFVVRFFSLAIAPAAFTQYVVSASRGLQKTTPKVVIKNVSEPATVFIAVVGVLLLGGGLVGLSLAYFVAHLAVAIVSFYYLIKLTPVFDRSIPVENRLFELLPFSIPLLFTTSMTMILSNIDVFFLGMWSGTDHVGLYKSAYPIAQLLLIVYTSFRFLLLPLISEMHADGLWDEIDDIYSIIVNNIFIVTYPIFIVLILFPNETITLIFRAEYVTQEPLLPVLALGFFIHAFAGPDKNILISTGDTKTLLYIGGIGAITNIILNVVLIPEYSYQGAAVATTVSYILINLLYIGALYRFYGISPFNKRTMRILAVSGMWLILLALLSRNLEPNRIQLLILGMFLAATYIPSTFILSGPDNRELEALRTTAGKITNKITHG